MCNFININKVRLRCGCQLFWEQKGIEKSTTMMMVTEKTYLYVILKLGWKSSQFAWGFPAQVLPVYNVQCLEAHTFNKLMKYIFSPANGVSRRLENYWWANILSATKWCHWNHIWHFSCSEFPTNFFESSLKPGLLYLFSYSCMRIFWDIKSLYMYFTALQGKYISGQAIKIKKTWYNFKSQIFKIVLGCVKNRLS